MRSLMRKWVAFVLGGSGVAHPWVGSFRLRLQRLCWSVLEKDENHRFWHLEK